MRDLVHHALRRNLQRAQAAGDTARAERLQQLLNPPSGATPAAVEEVTPPAVVSTEQSEVPPVELEADAPVEAEE